MRASAAALALALACGGPPAPLPRVAGASPTGKGVPTTAAAAIWFTAPVDPDGLLDGRRVVLAEAAALRDAVAAVEGEGAAQIAIPARAVLEDGGARIVLRPDAPLRAHTGHVLVLSSLARAADGRPVLDPDGRRRTFVAAFETGAQEGPPPVPVLTEVRARAAAPEPGGEYLEVANLGEGRLDLAGWRVGTRTSAGAVTWCTVGAGPVVEPGRTAVVAGGAWDGRYALPPGAPVLSCGATALDGGIAEDRPPSLQLADPSGAVASTLGENGAPLCPIALERIDPRGPDRPENLGCTEGSPGLY